MKLVILESYVMEPGDLDWSGLRVLVPDVVEYVRTPYEQIAPRIGDAELVVLNKCRMDEAILSQCPNLRWVGIIATGTDNLDLEACRRHGVSVANVPAYSTYSVAQMAFSLLLTLCQCPERQDRALRDRWSCTARPSASAGTATSGGRPRGWRRRSGCGCWSGPAPSGRSTPPTG